MKELKVLIVDDDHAFRHLLKLRLKDWRDNLNISIVGTLGEANDILSRDVFELIILDQHLPDGMSSDFYHPALNDATVLAVSSDDSPDIPGRAVRSGAQHFLGKRQISDPLLPPLLNALLERKEMEKALFQTRLQESKMDTIKRLLTTLRHEINNPLGAVLGGTYLVKTAGNLSPEQIEALELISQSGNRIKHVLHELCQAADLTEVEKASEELYQIPGDKPWENS